MKRLGVLAIVVSMCAIPVSAAEVDGHVYADFVSYQGAYTLYGATSIAEAIAVPHDEKYVKIGDGLSSLPGFRVQFPAPALAPSFRVHLAGGTTSRYFTVQGFTTGFDQPRYSAEDDSWTAPDYDVTVWYADRIGFVEVRQRQERSPGTVYVDAIEALNTPPVVSAGPDLTITTDQQATTTLAGKIKDIGAYATGYVWQKNGVTVWPVQPPQPPWVWLPFVSDDSWQSAPLELWRLAPLPVGSCTFRLVAIDGGSTTVDEMILTVSSNHSPVAVDDMAVVQIGSSETIIDVLANDSDADQGDVLSIVSFTQGAHGAVAAAGTGLSYTPNADYFGADSFTYTITDSKTTATATVTVTVNRPPVAAPDAAQTEVSLAVTIPVLANDDDPDGDLVVLDSVGLATNGAVTANLDGTVTYTPTAGWTGQDQFMYTIKDGKGGSCTADVGVVVNPRFVLIDIKPGSYPNSINLGSNGVVPVAILSNAGFDATTVDPATVTLAGADVAVRGKGNRLMASNQDVNVDGFVDLVLHVETQNLDLVDLQDGYATVVGKTYAGMPIIGTDEITLVPPMH